MNYIKIYTQLIEKRKLAIVDTVHEIHHILPKCLGGSDDDDNLVKLTPREHYIAHLLLIKIHNNNVKLLYAMNMMRVSNGNQRREFRINGRLYELLKIKLYNDLRISNTGCIVCHNPDTGIVRHLKPNEDMPASWKLGSGRKNNQDKHRYFSESLNKEIFVKVGNKVPDGYIRGTTPFKYIYNTAGDRRWLRPSEAIPENWFLNMPVLLKYIDVSTGNCLYRYDVELFNDKAFVLSKMSHDRNLVCVHLITKETAVLTLQEYDNNVYWITARLASRTKHLFVTNIGLVRSKSEYIRKSNRSINLSKYCLSNNLVCTSSVAKMSDLPLNWIGRSWKELGFGILPI